MSAQSRPSQSQPPNPLVDPPNRQSVRKSWHALNPFSQGALSALPNLNRPPKYKRADDIPDTEPGPSGTQPAVVARDYNAINPVQVRVPKKIATPIRVEGKVWFANERTWVSWLNNAVILGTLSLALFNASRDDVSRYLAYTYAVISIGVLIYGYALYQHRITMIRRRDPGSFDALAGPIVVSVLLFFAILANFIIRVRELHERNIPLPGAGFLLKLSPVFSGSQWTMQNPFKR